MSVCIRCKKESLDKVCSSCGMFVNNEAMESATKEESLSVINNIRKKYIYEISKNEKKIEELKREIRNAQTDLPKYSRIRFLWPFFLIGFVVMIVIGVAYLTSGGSTFGLELIMLIALALTVLVGVGISGKIQDKRNEPIYELEAENLKKKREAEREVEKINTTIQDIKYALKDLSDVIPLSLLTERGLKSIESIIASGETANISEAVNLVKKGK